VLVNSVIDSRPRAGEGVHIWLLRAAHALRPYVNYEKQVEILTVATANCGRRVPQYEIENAVKKAGPNLLITDSNSIQRETQKNSHTPVACIHSVVREKAIYLRDVFLCINCATRHQCTATV
jgi:hypothetical protein